MRTISSWGRQAKRSVMFITSWGTSPIISSSSITIFLGGGAFIAAAAAATRSSDSLTICSRRSFDSSSAANLRCFASPSSFGSSTLSFWRVSSKICSFCSYLIVDGTCRVADKSGVEEAIGWWFLRDILVGVQEVVVNWLGYVKSKEQAYWQLKREEEEGKKEAAFALSKQCSWWGSREQKADV